MSTFNRISAQMADNILRNNKEAVLLDIRDHASFDQGHAEKAIHISQNNYLDFISSAAKHVPVLVMCYHGNSSQQVAYDLAQQGFSEVYSIDGGYEGWILASGE